MILLFLKQCYPFIIPQVLLKHVKWKTPVSGDIRKCRVKESTLPEFLLVSPSSVLWDPYVPYILPLG